MTLEWLRRRDPQLDQALRTYLFRDGSITAVEQEVTRRGGAGRAPSGETAATGGVVGSLRIGALRDGKDLL